MLPLQERNSPQPQAKGNMVVTAEHGVPKAEMNGVNNECVQL